MKRLAAAALALCISAPAFAQTPNPAPSPSPAPAPESKQTPAPSAGAQPAGSHFVTSQGADQWLVGDLWRQSVYNTSGASIGDVKDVLIDRDGRVRAIVVGVGGFLGLGEKNVAVDFSFITEKGTIGKDRITVAMTEQDLRDAPSFERLKSSANNSPTQ